MRINRGETAKFNIQLSSEATQRIEMIAENMAVGKGAVMSWALSLLLDYMPHEEEVQRILHATTLEDTRTSFTVTPRILDACKHIATRYDREMIYMFGHLVSHFFEDFETGHPLLQQHQNKKMPVKLRIHRDLHEQLLHLIERNYTKLSVYAVLAALKGPHKTERDFVHKETVVTRIPLPAYIKERIELESEQFGMTQYDYLNSCLYNYLQQ